MRWQVFTDAFLLHDSALDDYKLLEPKLSPELNTPGTFTFEIEPNHPNADKLQKLKSIITVYQDGVLRFRGRVITDKVGFRNQREVECEGELAFLLDSLQRPFDFPSDEEHTGPADYFAFLLDRHNEQVDEVQQFELGTVTVTDPNNYIARSDTEYSNTWDLIRQGLLDTLGGYLYVDDTEEGKRRLNYLADLAFLSNQPIELGRNILDITLERDGAEVATALLPLGHKESKTDETTGETTDEYVTIADEPDEETDDICKDGDFVYSKVAEAYHGCRIMKVQTWDDVTSASNLLTKAKAVLATLTLMPETIEISAADLSAAGYDFNAFKIGTYVTVKSALHGLNGQYLVRKLEIELDSPASNTITIGETTYSLVEQNRTAQEQTAKTIEQNLELNKQRIAVEIAHAQSSILEQTSESILATVEETYSTKDETNTLVSDVKTEVEQTAGAIDIRMTSLSQDISDLESGTDAKFVALDAYVHIENGEVTIGRSDIDTRLVAKANLLGFYKANSEQVLAYFQGDFMHVPQAEIETQLKLGDFAFVPRSDGSLDFKWVGPEEDDD